MLLLVLACLSTSTTIAQSLERDVALFEILLSASVEPKGGQSYFRLAENHPCQVVYFFQHSRFQYSYFFYPSNLDSLSVVAGGGMEYGYLKVHTRRGYDIRFEQKPLAERRGRMVTEKYQTLTFYFPDDQYAYRAKKVLLRMIGETQNCLEGLMEEVNEPTKNLPSRGDK